MNLWRPWRRLSGLDHIVRQLIPFAIDATVRNHHIRNNSVLSCGARQRCEADYFVSYLVRRPNVQKEQQDVRIALLLKREVVTVSIDFIGRKYASP